MRLLPCLSFLLLTAACVPLGTPITDPNGTAASQRPPEYYADRTLRYEDYIYDPDIKSVQCYVGTGVNTQIFQPPVVPLGQTRSINLEFDLLGEGSERLTTKLIHCDVDWKPSVLTDLQFLTDINEFLITSYQTSVGTKTPYYHYRTTAPAVKLSGNYLWVVQNRAGVPLLSRRLVVYESQVQVSLAPGIPPGGEQRYTLQQLDFSIGYGSLQLVNPAVEVKVVLRQNFRWDNAHYGLRPTFVRDADQRLEYQYFNYENAFPGLSEYRFFDTRSIQAAGLSVQRINPKVAPTTVLLVPEVPRGTTAYNQYVDVNGQRVFESREYGDGRYNADYAATTFQLKSDQPAPGPVYIFGALTDWRLKDEFKMEYNEATQQYTTTTLLKQGYYNYDFAVAGTNGPDETYFEGTHQQTENNYDLLVYYRPPGTRADLLIGYQMIAVNSRQ